MLATVNAMDYLKGRFSFLTALAILALVVRTDAASERAADSVQCKEITARLIEVTGASFDRYSPSGSNVFLKNPDMVLSCTAPRLTGISLTWTQSGFPPNEWFELLAQAGKAVTGVGLRKLEVAVRQCHRAALRARDELGEVEIPNAKIECQAFTRDGGGVVAFVWLGN